MLSANLLSLYQSIVQWSTKAEFFDVWASPVENYYRLPTIRGPNPNRIRYPLFYFDCFCAYCLKDGNAFKKDLLCGTLGLDFLVCCACACRKWKQPCQASEECAVWLVCCGKSSMLDREIAEETSTSSRALVDRRKPATRRSRL
jgi:hypothetical protein